MAEKLSTTTNPEELESSARQLLLFSTPRPYGEGYLESSIDPMKDFLGDIDEVLFIPYAHFDFDGYTSAVRKKLGTAAINLVSVHETKNPKKAVERAKSVLGGGGNTFHLLKLLYDNDLIAAMQDNIANGMPYIGTSAGTVVAGPTIRTWEEMPIVLPPSLDALNAVPFEIRPHYMNVPPEYVVGNSPQKRIEAFHKISDTPVVALHERARIHVSGNEYRVEGAESAIIFEKGQDPRERAVGELIDL